MWPKLAAATALLLVQGVTADDCSYTVSVLDVAGVQCVSSEPCSGTYYASGLSQGVGACPSGTSCALLPLTPIMGCAESGRSDLVYVNADGSLTKGGRTVTLSGASSTTSSTSGSTTGSSSEISSSSTSNAASGSGSAISSSSSSSGGSDANTTTSSSNDTSVSASSAASNTNNSSHSLESDSGSNVISPGSSSANQQAEFNPGSILSDGSDKSSSSSDGGLGLGSIIGIVVGCLAVVAIAAGMRLLKKGKEAELETPDAGGAVEGYGGGGGMTPKENVLLL